MIMRTILVAIILLLVDLYIFTNILAIRNRTDKQMNEGADGIADPERKRQKHSDSMKKKCPECPISFVFQVTH